MLSRFSFFLFPLSILISCSSDNEDPIANNPLPPNQGGSTTGGKKMLIMENQHVFTVDLTNGNSEFITNLPASIWSTSTTFDGENIYALVYQDTSPFYYMIKYNLSSGNRERINFTYGTDEVRIEEHLPELMAGENHLYAPGENYTTPNGVSMKTVIKIDKNDYSRETVAFPEGMFHLQRITGFIDVQNENLFFHTNYGEIAQLNLNDSSIALKGGTSGNAVFSFIGAVDSTYDDFIGIRRDDSAQTNNSLNSVSRFTNGVFTELLTSDGRMDHPYVFLPYYGNNQSETFYDQATRDYYFTGVLREDYNPNSDSFDTWKRGIFKYNIDQDDVDLVEVEIYELNQLSYFMQNWQLLGIID